MLAAVLLALLALDLRIAAAPDACPARADVAAALAARLPAGAAVGWTLSLAPIAGGERALLLELTDPRGVPRLARTLAGGEATCRSLADAVALVLERYFSELGSGEEADAAAVRAPAPPPAAATRPGAAASPVQTSHAGAPAPTAGATSAGAAAPTVGATSAGAAAPAPAPRPPRLEAIAAVGGGRDAEIGPRASLELRALLLGRVEVGVGVGLPATRIEPIAGGVGSARLTAWPLRFSAGAPFSLDGGRALVIAADALIRVEAARTEGIPRVAERSRTILGLGVSIAAMQRLSRRFRVGVELAAHGDAGPTFVIKGADGNDHEVLKVPSWDVLASVRVGFALLP
jgi:hypothetical protein